jgi:hyperosmotically inducible periplasmic protein
MRRTFLTAALAIVLTLGMAASVGAQDRATLGIAREVRHELLMMPYYGVFDWLQFEVQGDGTVALDGWVTRPTLKSRAEKIVSKVEGVRRVVNNIEVLSASPSDDRIRLRLYREIYSGPLFKYQVGSLNTIHIIVNRGHVILKGEVLNDGDRTIAYHRASSVPGIFSVKNELVATNVKDEE